MPRSTQSDIAPQQQAQIQPAQPGPIDLIRHVLDSGHDAHVAAAVVRDLMAMQREHQREQARQAYSQALAAFQAEVPAIAKDRKVRSRSGLAYEYAALEDIMQAIRPAMGKYGLSVRYEAETVDAGVAVTCYVTHGSHTESATVTVPIPQAAAGGVNDAQKYGMALSYGRRYALCCALGLVVGGEDQDAAGLGQAEEAITDEMVAAMQELIESTETDMQRMLSHYGVGSIAEMSMADYRSAMGILRQRAAQKWGDA